MRWGRLVIRTQIIVYDRENGPISLSTKQAFDIKLDKTYELKELNCERLHPRCSRLTCIEETKIKENDKILQQCVVWRSIVVTLFCFL
jgi:hypothetical protein